MTGGNVSRKASPASAHRLQDISIEPSSTSETASVRRTIDPALESLSRREVPASSTASSARRSSVPFASLPRELQDRVVGYLDGKSTAQLAISSRGLRALTVDHPDYESTIRSSKLARRLGTVCRNPAFWFDEATVNELRECSPYLIRHEVMAVVDAALHEHAHGRWNAKLIGAAIGCHSELFQEVANAIGTSEVRFTRFGPQEQANKWERASVLADVLTSIGSHATGIAYAPFEALMNPDLCTVSGSAAERMTDALPGLHIDLADATARFVLAQEPIGQPDAPDYEYTLGLFRQLPHVSPAVRDAVFSQALDIHTSIRSSEVREAMAADFSVANAFSDGAAEQLPEETKNSWRGLLGH